MSRQLKKSLTSNYARIARKAAYWQKDYDEWKKYGAIYPSLNISEIINNDLLEEYMDNGWGNITEIYKEKMNNNSKLKFKKNSKMQIHFQKICKEKQ